MARWWRLLAAAAAVGLSATGCGGDDAPPAASALPTATAPGVGAAEFQAALDRLVLDRAVARTDRAEAAAKFNSADPDTGGSDRTAATDGVRAACVKLQDLYGAFAESLRRIAFDEQAEADVDGVLGATGELVAVLAKYAEATAPEQFAAINSEELVGTAVWEEAVRSLAATIGASGLPASTAAPTTSASPVPTDTASPVPTDTAGPAGSPVPTETPDPSASAPGSPTP